MIPLTAGDVAEIVGAQVLGTDAELPVVGVAIDSRALNRDDAFFAIIGNRDDGHRYVGAAVAGGASAIVVEREVTVEVHGTPAPVLGARRAKSLRIFPRAAAGPAPATACWTIAALV